MRAEQRMLDCVVTGNARLRGVSTTSTRADGNTVHGDSLVVTGISVASCVVTNNHLTSGSMRVEGRAISGEISGNTLDDGGIELSGVASNVPIEGNAVTRSAVGTGIAVYSVSLRGLVRNNTVSIPYASPTGVPAPFDTLGPAAISTIGVAVAGVRNNTVSGGSYGIYLSAVAGDACMNTVEGAHTGIAVSGVSAHADSNDVRDCAGDGIGLYAAPDHPYEDAWLSAQANTVANNAGAGIYAAARCDLGGAPEESAERAWPAQGGSAGRGRLTSDGLNVLTGNGLADLMVATQAAAVDTIWALWNTWDHGDSTSIGVYDVHDIDDDPSLSRVVFWPAHGR
jgi:hypothetical protein